MFSISLRKGNSAGKGRSRTLRNWSWQEKIRSLSKNTGMILGIGYLFYGTVLAGLPGLLVLPYFLSRDYERSELAAKEQLRMEFREALQAMSAAMHAGYAAENAVREAIRDLRSVYGEQAAIVREFCFMWNEVQMQIPIEKVWTAFGVRSGIDEIREFAVVFQTAKRSGGDMMQIMDHTAEIIGEKLKVRQEIRTILSAKILEWKIMSVIPFAIILYMKISFPEFMDSLYGNAIGISVMTTALLLILAARKIGEKILDIQI